MGKRGGSGRAGGGGGDNRAKAMVGRVEVMVWRVAAGQVVGGGDPLSGRRQRPGGWRRWRSGEQSLFWRGAWCG
ncbi:hypothetical protein GUJ93_ZPchr0012g19220 [Zizania palustris]|uniref:Uncharacterized protein n=1 Tax=Zizania palustris TaxID=103762 RepID=A0A8J5WLY5_ZIZPA|nr:hypothetical protein GUJ93_ZPchr0012g19220 [Zizania palustris]